MKRIILVVILIVCFLLLPFISASSNQINNEDVANTALKYEGQKKGDCIIFVRSVLQELGIAVNSGSYRNAYLDAGAREVSRDEASKGDIIQLCKDSDEKNFHEGMHTAIILNKNFDGNFYVVDSNSQGDGFVRTHNWNPYSNYYENLDLDVHIYRFGLTEIERIQIDISASQNADQSATPTERNFFGVVGDWFKNLWNNITNVFTAQAAETPTDQSTTIAASQESQSEIQGSVTTETVVTVPTPSKPSLTSPYNWYQSLGEAPTLIWKGDENSISYYVIVNSSNTGDIKSGWISSTSWKPSLPNENYIYSWKVKAKNSQGVESEWSENRNFSVVSTTLKFEGDISFSPPSPSSADQIKIFASTTGWGGVGVTLRVSVNTAPDGSSNGEWRILKELGVPKFNEVDAPVWDTKGWQNGIYRIRVEAKGPDDPNWQNPAIIEDTYTLINKDTSTVTQSEVSEDSSDSKTNSSETNNNIYNSALSVTPTQVQLNQTVTVTWSNTNPTGNDWISMHPAGAQDSNYITWQYAQGSTGSLTFNASSQAGTYEFRFFRNGDKVATSNQFTVTGNTGSSSTALSATSTEIAGCDERVDLGNEQDEAGHDLQGWAGIWRDQPKAPSGDTTFRYQYIRGWASLKLCVPKTGVNYLLITEVQDYGCDDSFKIYINDRGPVYSFKGSQSNTVVVHSIVVPSTYIDSTTVKVSFKNTATDGCGAAAVYNVELKIIGE